MMRRQLPGTRFIERITSLVAHGEVMMDNLTYIALDGLERGWAHIERATRSGGTDREARWHMMSASMQGALAFQKGLGCVHSLSHSLGDNWRATRATITFLPRIVTSSGRKQVSGPTGIVDVSQRVVSISFTWYLLVLGLVSLSLAILNLLPLLPLDGGHILFSIVEGLRGRAVGREVYERVSAIGIALFLVLMFIGLSNDISRLGGG